MEAGHLPQLQLKGWSALRLAGSCQVLEQLFSKTRDALLPLSSQWVQRVDATQFAGTCSATPAMKQSSACSQLRDGGEYAVC
jgi:hypothetical protein